MSARERCCGCGQWFVPSGLFCWSDALDGWYCLDCFDPPLVVELFTPALGVATRAWLAGGDGSHRRVWRWRCPVCGAAGALVADRHMHLSCTAAGCSPSAIGASVRALLDAPPIDSQCKPQEVI